MQTKARSDDAFALASLVFFLRDLRVIRLNLNKKKRFRPIDSEFMWVG